jgi:hypothetical protein
VTAPRAPFLENVIPEGLGAIASWAPNSPADSVDGYTLNAVVSPGYTKTVSATCSSPSTTSAPASSSAALVTGLCAHIPYVLTVTATNSAGSSPASNPSNPVVPLSAQPPSSPLITSVLARNDSLVVAWTPPTENGGDQITRYTLTATTSSQSVESHPSGTATHATVKPLSNGTAYAISLVATSRAGSSAAADSSGTPSAPYVPSSPQGFQVVQTGSGGLAASWGAPVDNGGDAIENYIVTYQREVPNGSGGWQAKGNPKRVTLGPAATSYTMSGLAPKTFWTVGVAASSTAGTGTPVTTPSPVTPTITLQPDAVELSASTISALGSDDGGTLTWPAPVPSQVKALSAGSVLVGPPASADPDGLLVKVESVSQGASGAYVVQTGPASLTAAFANLSLDTSGNPSVIKGAQFRPATPGLRVISSGSLSSGSTPFTLAATITYGNDSLSATLAMTPSFNFSAQITTAFGVVPNGASVSASASLAIKAGLALTVTRQVSSLPLGSLDLPPIDAGPLVIFPVLALVASLTGKVSVGISASTTIGAGMAWSTSNPGSLQTENLSQAPQLTAGVLSDGDTASESATVSIEAEAIGFIDDETGPYVALTLALTATVNFNPPAGTPFLQIAPGISISVGWEIALGPFNTSLSATLGPFNFTSFTVDAPPPALVVSPADPSVLVGTPVTFTAARVVGETYPISWILEGGENGDSITADGVLTVADPPGRQLTVVAEDSMGAVGETTVTVNSFDPPADLRATIGANGEADTLSWKAPTNTGGSPIASYVVVQGGSPTVTLGPGKRNYQITGLKLGTFYSVSVYATDTGGLTSPPALTEFLTPQPGALLSATALVAPVPANAATPALFPTRPCGDSSCRYVTCPAAGTCVAVGDYVDNVGNQDGLIEDLSGGTWNPLEAPLPANAASSESTATLWNVACPAPGHCVADGDYLDAGGNLEGLTEVQSDGTWNATELPLPDNAAANQDLVGGPVGPLACPSAGFCVAVGQYVDTNGNTDGLLETLSNGTWSSSEAQLPRNAATSGVLGLLGDVTCADKGSCVAAGGYLGTEWSGDYQGLLETLSGGVWRAAEAPAPANADATQPSASLGRLTCTSDSSCIATGTYGLKGGTEAGSILTLSQGKWEAIEAPAPGQDVSCWAPGSCLTLGGPTVESCTNDMVHLPAVDVLAGGTWTVDEGLALPANAYPGCDTTTEGVVAIMADLDCLAVGSCLTVGAYEDGNGYTQGLIDAPPNGFGTATEAPLPANAATNPGADLESISCPPSGSCVAIGYYSDTSTSYPEGLIETLDIAGQS